MKKHTSAFAKLVEEVKEHIKEMDVNELQLRAATEDLYLIDVREKSEWDAGHAEGAAHLSKGILERDIEQAMPEKDALIVLYCGGGYRSALSAENLQRMGYTNVYSLKGGFAALDQ